MKKNIASLLSLFTYFLFLLTSQAQDLDYVKRSLNLLASPEMHGRGYVKNGDGLAAEFLAGEFKRLGLISFGKNYFQPYRFPINTFPGKVEASIDGNRLEAGRDFLVSSNSKGMNGSFELVWMTDTSLTLKDIQNKVKEMDLKDKFLVLVRNNELLSKTELEGVKGVILIREKGLTWSVSNGYRTRRFMVLEISKDKIPEGAKSITLDIRTTFHRKYRTQNVIGYIKGSVHPDSFLVFTAHYDHLGRLGNALFSGANDNASGTSAVLDLARHYSQPENKPAYSVAFMLFSGEEAGLLGSEYYAANPLFPLSRIRFLTNLDMVGTGSKGIKVVNGSSFETEFDRLSAINDEKKYLPEVGKRGPSAHSDHHPFFQRGVRAIFIYTMGDEHREYHSIYDLPERVPFTRYEDLFRLLTDFVKTF